MLQIDYRYVYNDNFYWMLDKNGNIQEVRIEIEMQYGEYYSGQVVALGGEVLERCPDSYRLYTMFKDNILFFNKFEVDEFLEKKDLGENNEK